MFVAVTGASGHLGSVLVPFLWERGHTATKVGRKFPVNLDAEVLIHAAAPDWRDEDAVRDFARFNETVARWEETSGGRVISVGSWWQYATGDAPATSYAAMKRDQQAMFATTLVPFSIYGTTRRGGRGFIPELVAAAKGRAVLADASRAHRDWIHARDVCEALRALLRAPEGVYEARTGIQYAPSELAAMVGLRVPEHLDVPACEPQYRHPAPPGWAARIDVLSHIRNELSRRVA